MSRKGLFCVLVCAALVFSQSIAATSQPPGDGNDGADPKFAVSNGLVVTSPALGNIWHLGKTYTIAWTIDSAEGFQIDLMDNTGTKTVHHITSAGQNIREYKWTIPNSIPAGNYRVRVRTVAVFEWQTSVVALSPVFEIRSVLTVTRPSQGDIWCLEKPYIIAWTIELAEGFGITLMDSTGTKNVHHIASVGHTSREYKWTVPASIPPGKYRVLVSTVAVFEWQTSVLGLSPVFEIRNCDAPDPFKNLRDFLRPLQVVEWWRIKNPRPFPNPCLSCPPEFDLGKIREIFAKANLQEQVQVELFSGNVKIAEFGSFGKGRVSPGTIKLQKIGTRESRLLQDDRGFRLIFKKWDPEIRVGQVIHTQNISMKEVAQPGLRR
ncbi:MAG: Ser-Thr-rich GPI-anchored membrane family protein [Acidobacteriota bacterium]|nr:Ser-Thr-rich GPI-anchored membrane family protein [Acidobacteriota bacterium]